MKAARLPAILTLLFVASAGSACGEQYRIYHTLENHGGFRVRVKNLSTSRYYESRVLSFKGRPWTINLQDGRYEISRSYGLRRWKSLGTYQFGETEGYFPGVKNNIYIGMKGGGWVIGTDGKWQMIAEGAPPVRLEIAQGLQRIPYFGIRGKAHQNPPGVLVTWVERGSAATKLKRNQQTYHLEANIDVITEVNGEPVRNFEEMKKMIVKSQGRMEFDAYDLRRRATLHYQADF